MDGRVREALSARSLAPLQLHAPSLAIVILAALAAALAATALLLGSRLSDSIANQRLHGAEAAAGVFASISRDIIEIEDGRMTPRAARRLDAAVHGTRE